MINLESMSKSELEETVHSEFRGLTLVGLVGICDPPCTDVPEAVCIIHRAGVRVFMVTGDFKLTAVTIAKQVSVAQFVNMVHGLLLIASLGWYHQSREDQYHH
jgi:sodium/potassium-transporting ATPase subunit alpha